MKLGILKETDSSEARSAVTPDVARKMIKSGFDLCIESGVGEKAGFIDQQYIDEGVRVLETQDVWTSDIICQINPPKAKDVEDFCKENQLFIGLLSPYSHRELLSLFAKKKCNAIALELIPRTSRAQSMDVLSSQANIGGYRAVLEAAVQFNRFLPMMMTSAGMSKPAKVIVLGVGVAGLQAIATAKRLGANVFAYDIRPEVREQICSLGAKVLELDVGEEGLGQGGYAKELSQEAQEQQSRQLQVQLSQADIIVSTASVPGRKAPILITKETVKNMSPGSVIVDMAAGSGGNCSLTQEGKVLNIYHVSIVGYSNYPSMIPGDASRFFGNNIHSLLGVMVEEADNDLKIKYNLEDDIIDAALVTFDGQVRFPKGS